MLSLPVGLLDRYKHGQVQREMRNSKILLNPLGHTNDTVPQIFVRAAGSRKWVETCVKCDDNDDEQNNTKIYT